MKNEDINYVTTNLQTAKYHSVQMGDTPCGSSTAIPRLAEAWNSHRFSAEFIRFCTVSSDMYCICIILVYDSIETKRMILLRILISVSLTPLRTSSSSFSLRLCFSSL